MTDAQYVNERGRTNLKSNPSLEYSAKPNQQISQNQLPVGNWFGGPWFSVAYRPVAGVGA